jgi:Na+/phosphate symporter
MKEPTPESVIGDILESLGKTVEGLKNCLFSRSRRLMNVTRKAFAASLKSSLPAFSRAIQRTGKSPLDERLLALLLVCQRLGIAMEDLVGGVQAIVETDACLTDKALAEISEVMALVKDLARDTNDAISSGNSHFREYAVTSARHIRERSAEVGSEHQERLVTGACSPKASFLYLTVMDSLKRVAQELGNLCEKA